MRSERSTRIWGIVLLVIGLALVWGMSRVIGYLSPGFARPGERLADGLTFKGTAEQARFALWLLRAVLAFGVISAINGLWQIATGRRSRPLLIATIALFVGLVIAALLSRTVLGG